MPECKGAFVAALLVDDLRLFCGNRQPVEAGARVDGPLSVMALSDRRCQRSEALVLVRDHYLDSLCLFFQSSSHASGSQ